MARYFKITTTVSEDGLPPVVTSTRNIAIAKDQEEYLDLLKQGWNIDYTGSGLPNPLTLWQNIA